MTQTYEPCVFCGHDDVVLDCRISVRGVLDADVTRCPGCGLLFVNPPPTSEKIAQLYDATYWDPPKVGAREASRRYRRQYRFGAAYGRGLERRLRAGRMLEIGTGLGFFLKGVADHCDWDVQGIDTADGIEAFAREKLGLKVAQGRFEEAQFADGQFDLVRAKDVLEHVPYPMPFLEDVRRMLRPRGRLELWVPNGPLDLAAARRAFKAGVRADMGAGHLLFMAPHVLRAMTRRAGFRVVHASVFGFRYALKALGLWTSQARSPAVGAPAASSSEEPLSEWKRPAPERGMRGTMLYARLRGWRSCHPALPAWLPFGFEQRVVVERE
jgi:2-polyprenyl-3-methyl-5-hydroxy-6-metoxy-1,4-benzoquinol methylase